MSYVCKVFDSLLDIDAAYTLVRICEDFSSYEISSSKQIIAAGFSTGLPQRFDLALQYVKNRSRWDGEIDQEILRNRPSHFRATFAYGEEIFAPGIEIILGNEDLKDAAYYIYDCPVIEPAIVFANLMLPGQSLRLHTDVPEFRGANRDKLPQWLLVVMHHSGLFERWRLRIATAVLWLQNSRGGAFVFYPRGSGSPPTHHPARFNNAVLFDADSVIHAVERIESPESVVDLRPDMHLVSLGIGEWGLYEGDTQINRFSWQAMRASISWKAYCFADERERNYWREGHDQLNPERILEILITDLLRRGQITNVLPSDNELATILVEEYVSIPISGHC